MSMIDHFFSRDIGCSKILIKKSNYSHSHHEVSGKKCNLLSTHPQCADKALLVVSHHSLEHIQVLEHALKLAHVAALLELLLHLLPQRLRLGALDNRSRKELCPADNLLDELDVGLLIQSVRGQIAEESADVEAAEMDGSVLVH